MRQLIFSILLLLCPVANVAQNTYAQRDANTGKYGLVKNGRWIIPAEYNLVGWDDENQLGYAQREKDGLKAVINQDGKIITDFEYTGAFSGKAAYWDGAYLQSLICVFKEVSGYNLNGVINRSGNIIVPCIYSKLDPEDSSIMKGFGVGTSDNKYGLLNLKGETIVEVKYSNFISPALLGENGKYQIVNIGGKCSSDDSKLCSNPIGGKWGAIDKNGKNLVPCSYDDVKEAETEPLIFAVNTGGERDSEGKTTGGKWGLVDDKNNILIPCVYDNIKKLDKELFAVNKGGNRKADGESIGGKWGLYANGKEIVACQFDNVPDFQNDVATVKINGQVKLLKNPLKDGSQIQIASGDKSSGKKEKVPVVSRYPAPDSDVDKNIPMAKSSADNTFAFIIANENYPDAPVPYSLNDGRMFKEYCQKTLGLPEKNINLYEDATFGNIITAVEKMKQIAEAYDGDGSVIFYYAGHGFPDEKQNTAFLLPIDGNASDITTTGYSLAKLYQELSELKLKSSIVFLDACFSGSKREDQMLSESRGVAIKVKEEAPKGNMLVFSAAQGDETAHQMEEKHHGLFTYYLLKELQATGGDVDMGTLTEYVTKQVKRQSVVINNKKQTPTVIPSQALSSSWQSMKLK